MRPTTLLVLALAAALLASPGALAGDLLNQTFDSGNCIGSNPTPANALACTRYYLLWFFDWFNDCMTGGPCSI